MSSPRASRGSVRLAVLVAALGYFVDIYDLILFLIVRVKSLRSIGVPAASLTDSGVLLLQLQMAGMLVGGVLFGVLGDKRGRVSVMFASIFIYSLANIANGFVTTVPSYAALRFVAGVGLAGELGAGVTLVSEIMSREQRGWGTTAVAGVGLSGAIVAALVGGALPWQWAYFIGGGLGLGLLALRFGLRESEMFDGLRATGAPRGNFFLLFASRERLRRYLGVILVGVPIWYTVSILVGLSPELSRAMGLVATPDPGRSVLVFYVGAALGDFSSGALSQHLRSRKKVLGAFLALTTLAAAAYFTWGARSLGALYGCCAALGTATGYWAVFVTVAAEQFGTNLRATAATTAPNFVRGAVVPMTTAFQALKGPMGGVGSAVAVGIAALGLALWGLGNLDETFGKNLDYLEE